MKFLRKIKKTPCVYLTASLLLTCAFFYGILSGASGFGFRELIKALTENNPDTPYARIFLFVRLPRVLATVFCGSALAVSGAVIQGVLKNRLASPSVIGVNAGAGLSVTVACALGAVGGLELSLFAFVGAMLAVLPISLGVKKWGASRGTVILLGVALNSFFGAISDTVITFVPNISILSADFRIGDFSSVTYGKLIPSASLIIISILILLTLSNDLSVLSLGEERAKSLGMNTGKMSVLFLALASLLAGSAVSVCGLVSFVGLLIPHAVRRLGLSASHLLPLSALLGAGFVTLCDTLSRTVFTPYELPVGIIVAFLGAPFFIFILVKGK